MIKDPEFFMRLILFKWGFFARPAPQSLDGRSVLHAQGALPPGLSPWIPSLLIFITPSLDLPEAAAPIGVQEIDRQSRQEPQP